MKTDSNQILLVEDSRTQAMRLQHLLETENWDVTCAGSAEEALEVLSHQPFDLLILDHHLPGMKGDELCRRLRAVGLAKGVPILMLASDATRAAELRGLSSGADDYVAKSADTEILMLRIRLLLKARAEKEAIEARASLVDKLEATNKELESFSYSVSHDLRAPLRHIGGYTSLLKDHLGESLDAESHNYMDRILRSVKQMGDLIADLLAFSQINRAQLSKSWMTCGTLVQEIIQDFQSELAGRSVEWLITPLPVVEGDVVLLRQVFANLIGNAIKFTGRREKAVIEIGAQAGAPGEVVFFVKDNGAGFDMQLSDRLFGVFQRLHNQNDFEGTGIGLANVRRIVSRHGGRTWAEGKPGEGAAFYFSLPIAASSASLPQAA